MWIIHQMMRFQAVYGILCWLFSTILCDVVSVSQEQEDREYEGISSVFLNKSVKICYPMSAS